MLVDRMRDSRKSPAVLLQQLTLIRGKKPAVPVFVFEGADDVAVYDVWIRVVSPSGEWEPIAGRGKEQVLAFRARLRTDANPTGVGVWFLIDHDYDGLRGQPIGDDLYVLHCYSIENALCTPAAVASMLRDEFRCAGEVELCEKLEATFCRVLRMFLELIHDETLKLFTAKRAGIPVTSVADSLSPFLYVGLDCVEWRGPVREIVATARPISDYEYAAHRAEFSMMPLERWTRGKFLMQFFTQWLDRLAEDRRSATPSLFPSHLPRVTLGSEYRSMRALASRTPPPTEFTEFARRALAR